MDERDRSPAIGGSSPPAQVGPAVLDSTTSSSDPANLSGTNLLGKTGEGQLSSSARFVTVTGTQQLSSKHSPTLSEASASHNANGGGGPLRTVQVSSTNSSIVGGGAPPPPQPASHGADRFMEMTKRRRGHTMVTRLPSSRLLHGVASQALDGHLDDSQRRLVLNYSMRGGVPPSAANMSPSSRPSLSHAAVEKQLVATPPSQQQLRGPQIASVDISALAENAPQADNSGSSTAAAAQASPLTPADNATQKQSPFNLCCADQAFHPSWITVQWPGALYLVWLLLILCSAWQLTSYTHGVHRAYGHVASHAVEESVSILVSVALHVEQEGASVKQAVKLLTLADDDPQLVEERPEFIGRSPEQRRLEVKAQMEHARAADATLLSLVKHYVRDVLGCKGDACVLLDAATLHDVRTVAAQRSLPLSHDASSTFVKTTHIPHDAAPHRSDSSGGGTGDSTAKSRSHHARYDIHVSDDHVHLSPRTGATTQPSSGASPHPHETWLLLQQVFSTFTVVALLMFVVRTRQ